MPDIHAITLCCQDPAAQQAFYADVLGMARRADGTVGYGQKEAGLIFRPAETPYAPSSEDVYWKIALAVPNIELACDQLRAQGVEVSGPRQFQDVGYLAHFQDPEGFKIELIDHWFKGHRPVRAFDTARLGGGAVLNLLTLRTHDIAPHHESLLEWGMTPLCIQHVQGVGFSLHFYGFTDERPPNSDLTAVENREWLYQRPYTVLELQEVHGAAPMRSKPAGDGGYGGAVLRGMVADVPPNVLEISAG